MSPSLDVLKATWNDGQQGYGEPWAALQSDQRRQYYQNIQCHGHGSLFPLINQASLCAEVCRIGLEIPGILSIVLIAL